MSLPFLRRLFRPPGGQRHAPVSSPSVFEAFENVADRYQHDCAIRDGHLELTYAELHARALRIATRLSAHTAPGPKRVALLFTNRVRAVVAIFGTLKAGHAFVPLDSDDPPDRISFILEDSEPVVLLTDGEHLEAARQAVPHTCEVINIEELAEDVLPEKIPAVDPNSLAYIFYTSGSTGRPKGVCQTQRNLLHFVRCYSEKLAIKHGDRLSLLYSLSFSAANMDIFGGLLNGATVCAYDVRRRGVPGLADWLELNEITVLHLVPTVFRSLTAWLDPGRVLGMIRVLDLGGEAVTSHDVELCRRHLPNCVLVNHLAATEASVIAQHIVDKESTSEDSVPIGRAPEGVKVRIETANGTTAATNEVGRIIVASPYVSPGYWRRPEQNAAIFSSDSKREGWRIFRSDDLGRIDASGLLHFRGRDGTRVKIRGQSVDLVEVETALLRCRDVRAAAVVAREHNKSEEADALVAHVLTTNPEARNSRQLRAELAAYLPQYMIPSVFAFPESLPVTASGKIDRHRLQAEPLPFKQATGVPLGDELEEKVASIFSEVLKRPAVAADDDFFLVGGDSILAVELQILLSEMSGRELPLKEILADSTVSGIATTLRNPQAPDNDATSSPILKPLRNRGHGPILFLAPGRFGRVAVSPSFLALLGDNQRVFAFQARGVNGLDLPHTTVEEMAAAYLDALREVQPRGPYLLGGLCAGGYVAIEIARMLRDAGEQVLPLLLIDPPAPAGATVSDLNAGGLREEWKYDLAGRVGPANPQSKATIIRLALANHRALARYKLQPYEGSIWLFASTTRDEVRAWTESKLRSCFSGPVQLCQVEQKHTDVLNGQSESFTIPLQQYLSEVRKAAVSEETVDVA